VPQVIHTETPEDEENPLKGPQHFDPNMWQDQPPQNYRLDRQQSTGMNSGQWGMYRVPSAISQGSNPQGMDQWQNLPNLYPTKIYNKNRSGPPQGMPVNPNYPHPQKAGFNGQMPDANFNGQMPMPQNQNQDDDGGDGNGDYDRMIQGMFIDSPNSSQSQGGLFMQKCCGGILNFLCMPCFVSTGVNKVTVSQGQIGIRLKAGAFDCYLPTGTKSFF
jgi:hypothetical protein